MDKNILNEEVPKRQIYSPLDLSDHPEIDMTDMFSRKETKIYWNMIGEIQ